MADSAASVVRRVSNDEGDGYVIIQRLFTDDVFS